MLVNAQLEISHKILYVNPTLYNYISKTMTM